MAVLGTKKFWRPAPGASPTQKENQILKNNGYINIQLFSVSYMSKGNFWQRHFGGKDTISLSTNLKYQSGVDSIEALTVQDLREVRSDRNYILGIQRYITVKVPAIADAMSIDVKMTSVKKDVLQAKFEMLNKPEFQPALQLAPTIVGQVITITSLVKKLFTDTDPNSQLEASYAGVISAESEDNPVMNGKLTRGQLIMISTNDGNKFEDVDEKKFDLKGDSLYYNGEQVENTYVIFNISYESIKGEDQKSNWFKKYNSALSNLDKIQLAVDQNEMLRIYTDSKTLWIEGNALLDADESYINSERIRLKASYIKMITAKYTELIAPQPKALSKDLLGTDILEGILGTNDMGSLRDLLSRSEIATKGRSRSPEKLTGENANVNLIMADAERYQHALKSRDVAATLSAVADVTLKGDKSFEEFYEERKYSFGNLNKANIVGTYDDDELDNIKQRILNCRDKFKTEGGEARIKCLCRVLTDVKVGNGGEIPDEEWQSMYDQLKCNK